MMTGSVKHECAQDAMSDSEEQMKLTEDCTKEQVREREITKIRETLSRQDKRDPERTKRFVAARLSRSWSQRLNLDEVYRAPSLFTWRY